MTIMRGGLPTRAIFVECVRVSTGIQAKGGEVGQPGIHANLWGVP